MSHADSAVHLAAAQLLSLLVFMEKICLEELSL